MPKVIVECKKCGYVIGEFELSRWASELVLKLGVENVRCPKCGRELELEKYEVEVFIPSTSGEGTQST